MSRITIKDLARMLNLSPSTISRALNDHPDISQPTKDAVRQLADELGYSPNRFAIHFRKKQSGLIGLIIPEMNMFFYPSLIQAAESYSRQRGYHLIILHSNNSLERETENLRICQQLGTDGVLASLSSTTSNLDHFEPLRENDTPVVLFDKTMPHPEFPSVRINDKKTAFQAVKHLVQKEYHKIVGLFGSPSLTITQHREQGFRAAMKEFNLTLKSQNILYAGNSYEAIKTLTQRFEQFPVPDALFIMSDELLLGAYPVIQKWQLEYGKQFGLAGISEGEVPKLAQTKGYYFKHSGSEVGEAAMALLFKLMNQKKRIQPSPCRFENSSYGAVKSVLYIIKNKFFLDFGCSTTN